MCRGGAVVVVVMPAQDTIPGPAKSQRNLSPDCLLRGILRKPAVGFHSNLKVSSLAAGS